MKNLKYPLPFCLALLFTLSSFQISTAQKLPDCIKTAKSNRPTVILIDSGKLGKFYQHHQEKVTFGKMKIVKVEMTYYLLSDDQNGPRVFAFELEQKGKKLFLNKTLPVHSCEQGDLSLDTFLQDDEKIIGCRLGPHTIRIIQKE